jgi:hypothetical protein
MDTESIDEVMDPPASAALFAKARILPAGRHPLMFERDQTARQMPTGGRAFSGCTSLKPELRAAIEKRFGKSVF